MDIENSLSRSEYTLQKAIESVKENKIMSKRTLYERICEVIIPEGVTRIGESAFADCVKLTKVSIPQSVNENAKEAFMNCSYLKEIRIPKSVEK